MRPVGEFSAEQFMRNLVARNPSEPEFHQAVHKVVQSLAPGLEMSQNRMLLPWPRDEVDERLHDIMIGIHETCVTTAADYGQAGNYVAGANIAGFVKVADSMIDQGVV
jgi:glutamate dehydrogenase/leucine dehydrogenase